LLRHWCGILRAQARSAGLMTNDHVLGLANTGHMTPATVQELLAKLPAGLTEMYFHPATRRDPVLQKLMPDYEHLAEFEALLGTILAPDIALTSYTRL
jgi:hypothetical protein